MLTANTMCCTPSSEARKACRRDCSSSPWRASTSTITNWAVEAALLAAVELALDHPNVAPLVCVTLESLLEHAPREGHTQTRCRDSRNQLNAATLLATGSFGGGVALHLVHELLQTSSSIADPQPRTVQLTIVNIRCLIHARHGVL